MTGSILVNNSRRPLNSATWHHLKAFRCHIAITKDDDDLYSAIVLNLPGTGSSGSTEQEAIQNAREAVLLATESYADDGMEIPWLTPGEYEAEIPHGCRLVWILVNA